MARKKNRKSEQLKVAKNITKRPSPIEKAIASVERGDETGIRLRQMRELFTRMNAPERYDFAVKQAIDQRVLQLMNKYGLYDRENRNVKKHPAVDVEGSDARKKENRGKMSKTSAKYFKDEYEKQVKFYDTMPTYEEYRKSTELQKAKIFNKLEAHDAKYGSVKEAEEGSIRYKAEGEEIMRRVLKADNSKIPAILKEYVRQYGPEAARDLAKYISKIQNKTSRANAYKYKMRYMEYYRNKSNADNFVVDGNVEGVKLMLASFVKYRASIHKANDAKEIIADAMNMKVDVEGNKEYAFSGNELLDYLNSFGRKTEYYKEGRKVKTRRIKEK